MSTKTIISAILILVLLSITAPAWATTYYVKGDGSDSANGLSWANAFATIQKGVDTASTNDEIWVKEYTYTLTTEIDPNRVVGVYGGFDGTETSRTQRDWKTNVTTVDGDNATRCFNITAAATIDGFTITGGYVEDVGGGIRCNEASPTIGNCDITYNEAIEGGGIYCENSSSPDVNNCTITYNTAGIGGGIVCYSGCDLTIADCNISGNDSVGVYMEGSSSTIENCIFSGNDGSAIYNECASSPTITNSLFYENTGTDGGAIVNTTSSPTITNCIFADNTASQYGGAIANMDGSAPTITNCVITGNVADEGGSGGGIFCDSAGSTITNCVITDNGAAEGAGIYNSSANSTIVNCVITDNTASEGAGIFNTSSDPSIINCTFIINEANYGGAIYNIGTSDPAISNCIFWEDSAITDGNEVYNDNSEGTCTPIFRCCDIQNSGGSGINWDTSLGTDDDYNKDQNPKFVSKNNPDGNDNTWMTSDDGFRLSSATNSPCIDAADGDIAPEKDILGNPRYDDPSTSNTGTGTPPYADMGPYEYQGS